MTGIEPAYSAWEADVLPLNYIGGVASEISTRGRAATNYREQTRTRPKHMEKGQGRVCSAG
jgi:hypothetical protein